MDKPCPSVWTVVTLPDVSCGVAKADLHTFLCANKLKLFECFVKNPEPPTTGSKFSIYLLQGALRPVWTG